jgi:hypothetical protein
MRVIDVCVYMYMYIYNKYKRIDELAQRLVDSVGSLTFSSCVVCATQPVKHPVRFKNAIPQVFPRIGYCAQLNNILHSRLKTSLFIRSYPGIFV